MSILEGPDTKKEMGRLLVHYTQDLPAEAALCFRAFALPDEAERVLRPIIPMMKPTMKVIAECLLDVVGHRTFGYRTLLNAAVDRGSCFALWPSHHIYIPLPGFRSHNGTVRGS